MSRELVQQAIHRAYRVASGLYGSEYIPDYMLCRTAEETVGVLLWLVRDLKANRRLYAQDVESTFCKSYGQKSLDVWHPEFKLWGIGFSADPYQAFFIPFDPDPILIEKFGLCSIHSHPQILELVKQLALEHTTLHHSTIDARALWGRYGVEFRDLEDSILVNYAIDDTAGDNSIDDLSWFHTEEGGFKKAEYENDIPLTIHELDWDRYARRGCHDADIERRIYFTLKEKAITEDVWGNVASQGVRPRGYLGVLKVSNLVGVKMTLNGAAMNREHLEKLIKQEQEKEAPLLEEFYKRPEVQACFELIRKTALDNPKDRKANSIIKLSDLQISKDWIPPILFYDVCKYPVGSVTDKGKRQVESEHLEKVKGKKPAHERLVDIYLGIKRIEKKLSTYLLPYVQPKMSREDEELPPEEKQKKIAAGDVDRFEYLKFDGCCHPLFNWHLARSGRGTSSMPNFQNIVSDLQIKMCFWSRGWKKTLPDTVETMWRHGMLTAGDFAQHEVRMCAWLCRDANMIANLEKGFHMINLALIEKMIQPGDVPSITKERVDELENLIMLRYLQQVDKDRVLGKAYGGSVYEYHYKEILKALGEEHKALFGEWKNKFKVRKTVAKESTFGPLYGMQEETFSAIHEIPISEAKELFESDRKTYPVKHAFFAEVRERAKVDGFVQSIFGKKRRLDYKSAFAKKDKAKIAELDRQGGNTIIQGPSSDIGLLCMDRCMQIYEREKLPVLPIGTIHDSLMNDSHPDVWEQQLRIQFDVMENFPTELLGSDHVRFKAEMEAGPNWGEMEAWQPT